MNGTIRFPHLGITLHQVIKTISVGNLEIACYGIVLAAAMVTGLLLVMKVADKTGQKGDDYFDLVWLRSWFLCFVREFITLYFPGIITGNI